MDDNLYIDLLLNKKKDNKSIMKDIYSLLESYKINIDISNDSFDNTLNSFILNYVKLIKFIEQLKDDLKNRNKIENLIEDIILKSENNISLSIKINDKKKKIKNNCEKNNNKNINIIMTQ